MNIMYRIIFFVSVFLWSALSHISAQTQTVQKTRIKLEYYKDHDKTKNLIAKITAKNKRNNPLQGVIISFYNIYDTTKVLLDNIKTNDKGEALLKLSEQFEIFKDSTGLMSFEVEFEGNDSCTSARKDLNIWEADLEVSFFQKNAIKFIEIQASKPGNDNGNIPLEDIEVLFYVKGTFSLLKIGEKDTDGSGKATIEFPTDIPGDTAGVLAIVTKIEENDDYGTVTAKGEINWGKPIQPVDEEKRCLVDTDSPLWMVYTLIILLSAVWFHYFYVIYQIIKIKLEGKKQSSSIIHQNENR